MNNMIRKLFILGCGAACATASATGAPSPKKFLANAMQDGMAEIAVCQLALQKSTNPAVKSFAERMIKDHSSIDEEIASLARSKNYKLPDSVSLKQRASYDLLKAHSGAAFDQTFMKHNVSDHEQDIKDFTDEANETQDAEVKSFALTTLKTLREHFELSRRVDSKVATSGG